LEAAPPFAIGSGESRAYTSWERFAQSAPRPAKPELKVRATNSAVHLRLAAPRV
jgi:hypothetical protein